MIKNIELELRAEIKRGRFEYVFKNLKSNGKLISKTKRLSVMFFGKIDNSIFDVRVRITNGKAEVVIKEGSLHAHDRIETSQQISKKQFLGMVRIFSQMGFKAKVGERETFNFGLGDGVIASLVKAKTISYLELEKMSSKNDVEKNNKLLREVIDRLDVKVIESENDFNELCNRLDVKTDWQFFGNNDDYKKIENALQKY